MAWRPEAPAWPAEPTRHATRADHAPSSLAGRRGGRRRPKRADRRADPAHTDARAGRSSGPGVSRPVPDARPVSRRRVGVRAADGAALLPAQYARLPPDRAD